MRGIKIMLYCPLPIAADCCRVHLPAYVRRIITMKGIAAGMQNTG